MAPRLSTILPAQKHQSGGGFAVNAVDLDAFDGLASPLSLLDDFLVSGQPFGPHPHAGFSAITYVLDDSAVALRSRDSLGNDLEVRPGGIVWLQAGRGAQHQEVPALRGGQMHGTQIYVNLSARNKLVPPRTMYMQPEEVPEWHNEAGDKVRVLVGSYGDFASPISPAEPYTILDVKLVSTIGVPLAAGNNTVLYSLGGVIDAEIDGVSRRLGPNSAIAIADAEHLQLSAVDGSARTLVLAGAALDEPVFADGPFIMNDAAGIRAAVQRFRAGEMGRLDPV